MRLGVFFLWLVISATVYAQQDSIYTRAYIEKSTRFAWLTYGGDLNLLTGGVTRQLVNNDAVSTDVGITILPRLTIGGIHFWGHADFYVSFPLSFLSFQQTAPGLHELEVYQGVETGARIYPLKLLPGRLSPFAGISFRRVRFTQESENSGFTNGTPGYGRFVYPIQAGVTYTTSKWHFTASGYYNYLNTFDYYLSPSTTAEVSLDPWSFNVSALRYIDSDRSMRSRRAVEQVNRDYYDLHEEGLLSAWFIGIGPSSALQISGSPYLEENFPYFYDEYSAAIMPDITFGRYFYRLDLNVNFTYRTYGDKYEGFNSTIATRRHSVGIESVKFLFNYLGFVPFLGPVVSFENLSATVNGQRYTENKLAAGVTFGWDIRVTRTGTSLLRTNLRYYPGLHMNIEGEKLMFDHLEFNFIQYVYFIGRKKAIRN